jgi:acyl-CoA synthetase (NDP forming)
MMGLARCSCIGLGGIFVEVFRDVAFRFAPIGRNEARRMVTGIKGFTILKGFRGKPPADTEALERALVSLSEMVINRPEIKELGINPLMVLEKGEASVVAGCRIILEPDGRRSESMKPL